jgi:glycosyl transferase family 4
MKIAILSTVWFRVPPDGYGGTELVTSLLTDGLTAAGHEVTLFASGDSSTQATLPSVYPEAPSDRIAYLLPELNHVLACYQRAAEFDVISDHTGLTRSALAAAIRTPVLSTIHFPP